MNASIVHGPRVGFSAAWVNSRSAAVPWHIWACVAATASIALGVYWDISWHITIGRDTFWTPAHLLIQAGALAALSSAYIIFRTTFARDSELAATSVRVLGFRGPLGAFICAWGGAAMLLSGPFDDWWHNAYGLDVKIVSPPHTLLAIGFQAIILGSAVFILRERNQTTGALDERLRYLFLFVGGSLLALTMMGRFAYTDRSQMHSAVFYLAVSVGPPLWMETFGRATEWRWARTFIASIYTISFLLGLWIFPLFPGEPRIGPVYQHVTHMVSLGFPVLILAPAIALDLLAPKMSSLGRWSQALVVGVVFVLALLAMQWPWADFLMSPASRNWIFGTQQIPYLIPPNDALVRNVFELETSRWEFLLKMGYALVAAVLSSRVGTIWGNWMRRVCR